MCTICRCFLVPVCQSLTRMAMRNTSNLFKVLPSKVDQKLDHSTKLESYLSQQLRSDCLWDRGEPTLGNASALLQDCLPPLIFNLGMIVLPAAQVLHQSSDGMAPRVVAKASGESDVACAVVAWSVVRVMPLLLSSLRWARRRRSDTDASSLLCVSVVFIYSLSISFLALFPFLKLCERGKEKEIKISVLWIFERVVKRHSSGVNISTENKCFCTMTCHKVVSKIWGSLPVLGNNFGHFLTPTKTTLFPIFHSQGGSEVWHTGWGMELHHLVLCTEVFHLWL